MAGLKVKPQEGDKWGEVLLGSSGWARGPVFTGARWLIVSVGGIASSRFAGVHLGLGVFFEAPPVSKGK